MTRRWHGRIILLAVLLCGAAVAGVASGADWPMWRYDANRSGASPQELAEDLHLQWTRELPPYRLAWPNEPRLHFDSSYEPVVLGKMLFIGSPYDGSVSAFDTETGKEKWKFYTEGPVRLAPVAWEGKVYFGSDDGYVYCLDAAEGTLKWKFRVAPKDRPDRRHLGNARLVSYWPVRGGPVIADGKLYCGAGIWPTLGVFLAALDAKTGRLLWLNGSINYIKDVRIDHNIRGDTGLSPQGYLLMVAGKLLVPNGRSMPAGLDPKTGKLLYYVQGYRNGDCRVIGLGRYAFVGRGGAINTEDGRELGSRWKAAGSEAPEAFDARKADLFEGPIFGYKMLPACNAWSVLVPGIAYGGRGGVFYAYDIEQAKTVEYEKEFVGHKVKPWKWDAPRLWRVGTGYEKGKPNSDILIKAGNRLYGHAASVLLAVDLPKGGGRPRIAWTKNLDGTPSSMIAADGKLFVVTKEGKLHCFGPKARAPKTYDLKVTSLRNKNDKWTRIARDILDRSGVHEGYCLVLGLKDGRLVEELLRQSELKLIAVDADEEKVAALRETLVGAGIYGTRAEVFTGKPFDFPFPPYLASLIVSEDADGAGFSTKVPAKRLFEVLRPYGGTLCLPASVMSRDALARWAARGSLQNSETAKEGEFVLLRRVGALPGAAYWTHETGDAARSYFSRDKLVKPPLGILWYGDGSDYGFFKRKDYGTGVKPQVIGGRLFAFQILSRTLLAYDVYTGRVLWKQPVERFTRYASMEDGIYVAEGNKCVVYDPATGEVLKTFEYKTENPAVVKDIRVADDLILIAVSFKETARIEEGLWESMRLVALDRKTGKLLWKKDAKERFNNNAIAVGGMVFCIDSPSPVQSEQAKRRGEELGTVPSTIMALDARTGKTVWTAVKENKHRTYGVGHWLGVRSNDDWLAYSEGLGILLAGKLGKGYAFKADSGKELWEQPVGGQPMVVRQKTFINQGGQIFDTATGRPTGKHVSVSRHGCNYLVGNEFMLFLRARSASYVDLATGKQYFLRNVRSGCSNSTVPADGLLNVPNFAVGCVCNYPIQTSFAMVHMPEVKKWAGSKPIPARADSDDKAGSRKARKKKR